TEEMRAKLRLLLLELAAAHNATKAFQSFVDNRGSGPVWKVDTATLSRLHADILPLLRDHPKISERLTILRTNGDAFNYELDRSVGEGMYKKSFLDAVREHVRAWFDVQTNARTLVDELCKAFDEAKPKLTA